MSDRLDVLKSLVRGAATRAGSTLRELGPVAALRRAVADVARQRAVIDARSLTNAVAHARGVSAASVVVRDGAIRVEASFESGPLSFSLLPQGARFAPRGAKELRFRVEPASLVGDGRVADVAGVVSARVARALWGALLRGEYEEGGAIVDRDGDVLRVDLRTVSAVRRAHVHGPIAAFVDVLELADLTAEEGQLRLTLRPPHLPR